MTTLTTFISVISLAAGVIVGVPGTAGAQTTASFRGTILDQSGAVVPGATVLVKNEKTGEERSIVSVPEGGYVVTNLKPSVYTISATFGSLRRSSTRAFSSRPRRSSASISSCTPRASPRR